MIYIWSLVFSHIMQTIDTPGMHCFRSVEPIFFFPFRILMDRMVNRHQPTSGWESGNYHQMTLLRRCACRGKRISSSKSLCIDQNLFIRSSIVRSLIPLRVSSLISSSLVSAFNCQSVLLSILFIHEIVQSEKTTQVWFTLSVSQLEFLSFIQCLQRLLAHLLKPLVFECLF